MSLLVSNYLSRHFRFRGTYSSAIDCCKSNAIFSTFDGFHFESFFPTVRSSKLSAFLATNGGRELEPFLSTIGGKTSWYNLKYTQN